MFELFKRKEKYLADVEYWVYIPGTALPDQDAIMDRLIRGDSSAGIPPSVGPPEGLLFSDIRLTIALALRKKNPHAFRPDLIGDDVHVTKELLEGLAGCEAMIKIRYLSEEVLQDNRHLKLLPNLVAVAGDMSKALAVYDVEQQVLYSYADFVNNLRRNPDPARPDFHVRSFWQTLDSGGQAQTRGLSKVGLRDFETKGMNADEQVLVTSVVEEAARQVFALARYPESIVVETFNDRFRVMFDRRRKGLVQATILRIHEFTA